MKKHLAVILGLAMTVLGACAVEPGSENDVVDTEIDTAEQAFTEATCSGTAADGVGTFSEMCPGRRYEAFVTSPNGAYDHTTCTNSFVADFPTTVGRSAEAYFNGTLPLTEAGCNSLKLRGRAFAYYGPANQVTVELTSTTPASRTGSWTSTGPLTGTCSIGTVQWAGVVQPTNSGYSLTRVRVVTQATTGLSAGSTTNVGATAWSGTCLP